MSFDKASKEFVPKTHRKYKIRSDKGKKRVRKTRKDKGKSRLPISLRPIADLPSRKGGPISAEEHTAVEALIKSVKGDESDKDLQTRGRALAYALGRSPTAIRGAIIKARQRLQENAGKYAELHIKAAAIAAKEGDAGPSQWALERITAPTEDGKGVERIVQPLKSADETNRMPVVNIGLALGGIGPNASLTPRVVVKELPAIDAETDEMP